MFWINGGEGEKKGQEVEEYIMICKSDYLKNEHDYKKLFDSGI